MAAELVALCFEADEPAGLARFWANVLGWVTLADPDGNEFRVLAAR